MTDKKKAVTAQWIMHREALPSLTTHIIRSLCMTHMCTALPQPVFDVFRAAACCATCLLALGAVERFLNTAEKVMTYA